MMEYPLAGRDNAKRRTLRKYSAGFTFVQGIIAGPGAS